MPPPRPEEHRLSVAASSVSVVISFMFFEFLSNVSWVSVEASQGSIGLIYRGREDETESQMLFSSKI